MRYLTAVRVVTTPADVVWTALLDLAHAGAWLEGVVRLEYEPKAPIAVGTVIGVEWQPRGTERSATSSVVTALRPAALLALETRGRDLLSFDRAMLEVTKEDTRIEWVSEVTQRGNGVLELLAGSHDLLGNARTSPIERVYERALDSFARHVQAAHTIPYR
jgi:hypothetical protein